jgi:hypothetical protein
MDCGLFGDTDELASNLFTAAKVFPVVHRLCFAPPMATCYAFFVCSRVYTAVLAFNHFVSAASVLALLFIRDFVACSYFNKSGQVPGRKLSG